MLSDGFALHQCLSIEKAPREISDFPVCFELRTVTRSGIAPRHNPALIISNFPFPAERAKN
jgi:hypothetical protein